MAISDNGLILLRAQDVLTSHHPLIGMQTSASLAAGRLINHPGPLWFDLLAPFVRIGGPSGGLALGVAFANAACIALAAWAARRVGGYRALLIVTALSAGLAWSMGSELLLDPWQPHAMILPFWSFVIVAWALASGDRVMAPVAVGLASLIVQTHLSFVYVLAIIGLTGVGLGAWPFTREPMPRPPWRRPLMWSGVVLIVAWIQPIIDQVAGEGNLFALLETRGREGTTFELDFSLRVVASVVALPPWWGRSGFSTRDAAISEANSGESSNMAVIALIGIISLLAVVVWVGRRRRSRPLVAIGVLAIAALVGAVISMQLSPVGSVGFSLHQLRWLWPISTFVLAALLLTLAGWSRLRHLPKLVLTVATALFAVLAVPMYAAPEGPAQNSASQPFVADLVEQIENYRPGGPVVFDASTLRYNEPFSGPTIAALARTGVDVVFEEGMVPQVGRRRLATGIERRRIFLVEGSAAESAPDGSRRIAFVQGLDGADEIEWTRLSGTVIDVATQRGVQLNEVGLEASAAGLTTFDRLVLEPGQDASGLADEGWLALLITNGWIDLPVDPNSDWLRYAELEARRQRFTVGLFEGPV